MQHPLMNPESKHYDSSNREPAVIEMEKQLTVCEMIGACKFNIHKYTYRKGLKGQKESDLKKIDTYKAYLEYLEDLKDRMKKNHMGASFTVELARKILKEPDWEY